MLSSAAVAAVQPKATACRREGVSSQAARAAPHSAASPRRKLRQRVPAASPCHSGGRMRDRRRSSPWSLTCRPRNSGDRGRRLRTLQVTGPVGLQRGKDGWRCDAMSQRCKSGGAYLCAQLYSSTKGVRQRGAQDMCLMGEGTTDHGEQWPGGHARASLSTQAQKCTISIDVRCEQRPT